MITKLNRQEAIKTYPNFPLRKYNRKEEQFDTFYPNTFSGYVLTLPSKSFKGHAKSLGMAIKDLTTHLGASKLIFLGETAMPWLSWTHDYKPAKKGLQYLAFEKVGKKFNGALQVDTMELPVFIKHLAWLVRTNAIPPYVYFIDHRQNISGTICQYGNLHINTLSKKADKLLKVAIEKTMFEYLTENCYNKFSKNSAIKGRQIII